MKSHAFAAMGTTWWLGGDGDHQAAEALVRDAESRLSRFLPGSALSRLNRDRVVRDNMLARVTEAALGACAMTAGAFDPRLGATLCALGYDRTFERLAPQVGAPASKGDTGMEAGISTIDPVDNRLRVEVDGDTVRLFGAGALDLGGIAKGWTVDRVFERLEGDVLVDGGGDIRARGAEPWSVGVGDDDVIGLTDGAVATSSTLARRWVLPDGRVAHHILDPRTNAPAKTTITVATVLARTAIVADIFATAILVDPERVLPLAARNGARVLVRDAAGRWWRPEQENAA